MVAVVHAMCMLACVHLCATNLRACAAWLCVFLSVFLCGRACLCQSVCACACVCDAHACAVSVCVFAFCAVYVRVFALCVCVCVSVCVCYSSILCPSLDMYHKYSDIA